MQVYLRKEQLSLDVIKQCRVKCPTAQDKQKVLKDMIFPNCEKLGQTIVFVASRANAHALHRVVCFCLLHCIRMLHAVTILVCMCSLYLKSWSFLHECFP